LKPTTRPLDFDWIDRRERLAPVAERLMGMEAVGVDLEGDSLFHYQEKVCLVQIATPAEVILIDPLGLRDLSPLEAVFADPAVRKVLHGSDYDIRSLDRDFGIHIHGLFDTQVAARFLGLAEISLADLLKSRFGFLAEKKYQKKDWSVRPLPEEMLSYAAADAAYLLPLATALEHELRDLDRLSWVEEECEILSRVRHNPNAEGPIFKTLRGAGVLDRRGLAVAEEVLKLRIRLAQKLDRPPFKVLGNQSILEIAESKPVTLEALGAVKGLGRKQVHSLGPSLLKCVQKALELPEESLPSYPRKKAQRFGPDVMKKIRALKAWREKKAKKLGLDPSVVLTNAQIHAISAAHPAGADELRGVEVVRDWQCRVFGPEVLKIIGRRS